MDAQAAARAADAAFAGLQVRLRPLLPAGVDIAHVGSTAVPGCLGKGDLDLCVRVDDGDFTAARAALATVFPPNPGMPPLAGFASFQQPGGAGVQLVVRGSRWDVFVDFRDRLRADAAALAAYNDLKRRFDGGPMVGYRAAKAGFIEAVLGREIF